MTYYRVKADCAGYPKYRWAGSCGRVKIDGSLVGEELYTPAERAKIANADKFFEKVEISQRKTYWFFGARFEDKEIYPV